VTTFNALRNSGARSGDLVGILEWAASATWPFSFPRKWDSTRSPLRGEKTRSRSRKNSAQNIISTANPKRGRRDGKVGRSQDYSIDITSGKAVNAVMGGLGINGKLILVGNPDQPLEVAGRLLIAGRRSISGWPSGSPIDSQDTLAFCALTGVRP